MKTKFLLFVLLMLLPWCMKAQEQSTVYKVALADLPAGLDKSALQVHMYVNDESGYENSYMLYYNADEGNYIFTSDYDFTLSNADKAKILVWGDCMLPTDSIVWTFVPEQTEQSMTVSLKDYRRVGLKVEEGWNFHEKISDSEYTLSEFDVRRKYENGISSIIPVGGAGITVSSPEDQAFYVYAEPGNYLWSGLITRYADDMKLSVVAGQPLSISDASVADVQIDWEHNSLVSFSLKKPLDGISDFYVRLSPLDDSDSFSLMPINGKANGLLPKGARYEWDSYVVSLNADIFPKQEQLTIPEQAETQYELDFSEYVKCSVSLKEKSGFPIQSGYVSFYPVNQMPGYADGMQISMTTEEEKTVYLPKGQWGVYVNADAYDEQGNYINQLPLEQNFSVNGGESLVLDFSSYRKVTFQCGETPINSDVSVLGNEDFTIYGNAVLLPDGRYYARGEYVEEMVSLKQEFTVSGSDMVVNYEYNPEDYTTVTLQVKNASSLPDGVDYYSFNISLYQNGEEVDELRLSESDGETMTRKVKKGSYTYLASVNAGGREFMSIPATGSLELNTESKTIVYDLLNDFCLVPIKVMSSQATPVENLYIIVDGNEELLDGLETGSGYLMIPPGTYEISFFAPRFRSMTQNVTIGKDTKELNFTMEADNVYPFMIFPYGMEPGVLATVTVEGVGSYQMSDDGEVMVGDMLPFMAVQEGTYKVTITAPGYIPYTGSFEVSEDFYSYEDGGVFYEIKMKKDGTGIESVEGISQPVVKTEGGRVLVQSEVDCRVMIYTMSGVNVFQEQGKLVQTETLQPGIYIVRMATPAGVSIKKVTVGR